MSISWTRAFGLSLIVCLIAVMAAPALAADPSFGRPASPASRGTGRIGMPGAGINLLASLQMMGLPVVGPMVAISRVERFVLQSILFPPRGTRAGFARYPTGIPRAPNRSATGARALGRAENLTAYLSGKGYDVTDLNAALSEAGTALQSSNMTGFAGAMRIFRTDLDAKITAGTVNRTVIGDYLKTLPGPGSLTVGHGFHGMGMRFHHRRMSHRWMGHRWMRAPGRYGW